MTAAIAVWSTCLGVMLWAAVRCGCYPYRKRFHRVVRAIMIGVWFIAFGLSHLHIVRHAPPTAGHRGMSSFCAGGQP